MNIYAF